MYVNAYLRLSCSLINYTSSGRGSAGQERGVRLVPCAGAIRSTRCSASEEIHDGSELLSFDALVSGSSEVYEARISKARAYARRLGTDYASSPKGHIFINGKYYVINDVRLPTTLFQRAPTHRQSSRTFWTRYSLASDRHFSIPKRSLLFLSRIVGI